MGDFNSVLSQTDKHNGEPVSTYENRTLETTVQTLGLLISISRAAILPGIMEEYGAKLIEY